jgi:hypothetical protein
VQRRPIYDCGSMLQIDPNTHLPPGVD